MIRMLIVTYCYGIRSERRMCEEVELDLDDKVPDHSTFSVNRLGCFRESDVFRHVFEAVVRACMGAGLVKGEAFAVDASVGSGCQPISYPAHDRVHAAQKRVRRNALDSPIITSDFFDSIGHQQSLRDVGRRCRFPINAK
jgi:hypothetical protein